MNNDNDLIQRSVDEQKRAIEIYDKFRDELLKRQLSNTENYDKSILTLSSAGLAISLTFLTTIVPMSHAAYLWLIKVSWFCFLFSIFCSLLAYLVSNAAITKQMSIAENYYVNKISSAFNQRNWLSVLNDCLNYVVGVLFSIAILAVVLFVTLNLRQEETTMSKQQDNKSSVRLDSAKIPLMQSVPTGDISINSAQVPTMQAAPSTSSSVQQTTQSGQGQSQQTRD
ncbi:hypothetical protein PUN32_13760 [Vibrio sp. dsl-7]|uniref:Uncharacterized protein n=1 Tax=Vibrio chanodichtyis TaxID=3027932 RepID=A0ABT5V327_9VIBR|nr:hypothetical protein [Vibrio chanodichtyis]MDE1516056.1 hypothetical protein [Vibrio chanodichtyis]